MNTTLAVFFLLYSLIPAASCCENPDECRNLLFRPAKAFRGTRLKNHVISVTDVFMEDFCMTLCYMEPNCVSYNFKTAAGENGKHECELNNSTHEGHETDLEKDSNYKFHGAESACVSGPCKNNGTCQAGFTDRGYRCLCSARFRGHNCQTSDVWQKVNKGHVCFGAKNNSYGTFKMNRTGRVRSVKLVHRSGSIRCNPHHGATYWGCGKFGNYPNNNLMTIITNAEGEALLPPVEELQSKRCGKHFYSLEGIGQNSTELVFGNLSSPLPLLQNQELQIWYGQDWKNCGENHNSGSTCVDVYALYT